VPEAAADLQEEYVLNPKFSLVSGRWCGSDFTNQFKFVTSSPHGRNARRPDFRSAGKNQRKSTAFAA
jgi:hypothetical protein